MEDRRREDRRKLYGKPFLAMLIGALPEDRRKGERRREERPPAAAFEALGGTVETLRGDDARGGNVSESNRPAVLRRPHQF